MQPRTAALVQGSVDAALSVRGTNAAPSFSGTVSAPEGSVNGLSFREFHGDVRGDLSAVALRGGHVVVGSSPIALGGTASLATARPSTSARPGSISPTSTISSTAAIRWPAPDRSSCALG